MWIVENKEWLVGLVTTVGAFFGGRKMKKNNEKSAELENLKVIREMEKELIADAKSHIEELRKIIDHKDGIIEDQKKIIAKQERFLNLYKSKYGKLQSMD
tara:strand:- start:5669 stop:5968 length:300 start_codon:yes stop_codon:yes gene_type:complete